LEASGISIRISDRILCDAGATWGEIRALLVDLAGKRFDRAVVEPAHRVAVGQFVAAEQISASDGVLVYDGYLAFVDMQSRAETPQWSEPHGRNVPRLRGELVPVEGLRSLEGDTPAVDEVGEVVGQVVGITVTSDHSVESLIVRTRKRLGHRDILFSMDQDVAEFASPVELRGMRHDLLQRHR
jgi:hypothetical protein